MYVVTFYSYKGGVGRTMALVNTAVMLARMNRRVLVVDFDLEAPGLPSYEIFRENKCTIGVVDYVSTYRTTGMAPNAAEYITRCDVSGAPIWLMPAGDHTKAGYSELLQSIDWQDLYEHQQGYLMFEDLKQQWLQYEGKGFDYVLVDSRTGHTDVGGICTRQLPDAVVVMFVPNEQNIDGLVPIVDSIKNEKSIRGKDITLHFCPSNVPDLDDEKNFLSDLLDDAKKKLKYDQAPIIHNYASLEILTQAAFAIKRPNSKLSKEYDALKTAIIARNFDDRDGALFALLDAPNAFERAREARDVDDRKRIRADVVDIRRKHPDDGEIAHLAAQAFDKFGDVDQQIAALTASIEAGYEVSRSLFMRSVLYLVSDFKEKASEDIRSVLSAPNASIFELGPALQIAEGLDGLWDEAVTRAMERPDSEFQTLMSLSTFIMMKRNSLAVVAARMRKSASSSLLDETETMMARNTAVVAFIGCGDFASALEVLGKIDPSTASPIDVFNYAIAEWGARRKPSAKLFEAFYKRLPSEPVERDANHYQCLALAHAVLGNVELAERELAAAENAIRVGGIDFSCWRYLYVPGDEFLDDIAAMQEQLKQHGKLKPAFFDEVRRLFPEPNGR
jgi:MinD-like ATPase involved in chromosome partitioning or flagellar assembly